MNALSAEAVKTALNSLSEKVFLAGFDGSAPARLTLHVANPRKRRSLRQEAQEALSRAGITARCEVRAFDHRRIERAGSLQGVLKSFAHEGVVYDPTGSVTRSQSLLRCVERLRGSLGTIVRGAYLEPEGRTLFVLCRREGLLTEGRIDEARRQGLKTRAAAVIAAWRKEDADSFDLAIRLCIGLPRLPLFAADEASRLEVRQSPWWSRVHAGLLASGISALLGMAFPGQARAGDEPAVSALNGKVSVEGGTVDGYWSGIGEGSVTAPLGHSFGVQADVMDGVVHSRSIWGVAGQGFWRDPDQGLLGGFASHVARTVPETNSTINANRYGGEGEYYRGKYTASVAAGYQAGQIPRGGFTVVDVKWYPDDNLMLSAGADIKPGHSLALLAVECQLGAKALASLSVFADAGISDQNGRESGQKDGYAFAGFRYYFGPAKSLIRRHREDDPPAFSDAGGGGGGGGAVSQAGGTNITSPTPNSGGPICLNHDACFPAPPPINESLI